MCLHVIILYFLCSVPHINKCYELIIGRVPCPPNFMQFTTALGYGARLLM